jgi:hypothetical protein
MQMVLTLLSTARSELLLTLSPASIGLLLLYTSTLIFGDRLPELDTEAMEYPEAFLQFKCGSVLTKEF